MSKSELNKTNFIEISKKIKKQIVLFGHGNIAKKTIRRLDKRNIAFIVDNSLNLQNTTFVDLDVLNPAALTNDYFILICSTAVREISNQLEEMGLTANQDFGISPVLNDLLAIQELEELDKCLYFTSGSISNNESNTGGGFYKCKVDGVKVELEKIYSGPCYGALKISDDIYFIDSDKGIQKLSLDGEVKHIMNLPLGSRAHGLSYNQDNGFFYVTCSHLDAVLEINLKKRIILRQFNLSEKHEQTNDAAHHCNDNFTIGNSLFVSMFSSSGQWKLDSFDGCIAEFDLLTGQRLRDVYTGLYMPHNIMIIDGSLHVLDSLPGHLRFSNFSIQGTFSAFTRGLAFDEGLYYIGQSKNRNYSKVMGLSNNVSIDCGIVAFNPTLKASRFIQLPYTIGEIHSIIIR